MLCWAWLLLKVLALPAALPFVALWPPLQRRSKGWTGVERGVGSPLVKFTFYFAVDVLLSVLVTLLAGASHVPTSSYFAPTLVVLAGVSWAEGGQLLRGGLAAYVSDPFNWIDATALTFTWLGIVLRTGIADESGATCAEAGALRRWGGRLEAIPERPANVAPRALAWEAAL